MPFQPLTLNPLILQFHFSSSLCIHVGYSCLYSPDFFKMWSADHLHLNHSELLIKHTDSQSLHLLSEPESLHAEPKNRVCIAPR